jgi:hypothetical protein
MADGTLVAIASNPSRVSLAEGPVAVDTLVDLGAPTGIWDGLINGSESMSGMGDSRVFDAIGAVVPVGAVQALVANPVDILVTSIAKSKMAHVAAGGTEQLSHRIKSCFFRDGCKRVAWVVAMLQADVARNTKVVVFTD